MAGRVRFIAEWNPGYEIERLSNRFPTLNLITLIELLPMFSRRGLFKIHGIGQKCRNWIRAATAPIKLLNTVFYFCFIFIKHWSF